MTYVFGLDHCLPDGDFCAEAQITFGVLGHQILSFQGQNRTKKQLNFCHSDTKFNLFSRAEN